MAQAADHLVGPAYMFAPGRVQPVIIQGTLMRTTSDVVSFSEGLRLLGVSRSSAYEYMADPSSSFLRPFRIGGRWRYRRSDVERWLAEQVAAAQVRSVHPLPRGALEAASA